MLLREFPNPRCAVFLLVHVMLLSCACADEHRFVLTSAAENVQAETFDLAENVSDEIASKWKIRLQTLHGGLQEGVRLITLDNGRIVVSVLPTRGMSILDVKDSKSGERLFGWDSPVKEAVHPRHIDLESRGGLGWLEGFNEWMVRCGLEFAGHPGTDKFTTNTGDEGKLDVTLHGRIGNLPASEVELLLEKTAPYRVRLRGVVYERMFYGPKLKLVTELSLTPGASLIGLKDSITNQGASDQEFQVIYHTNYGIPILEAGAEVVIAAEEVSPMNGEAAKGISSFNRYQGPTSGYVEQVYLIKPYSDSKDRTSVVLHNQSGDRGATVSWSTETLPYLTLWKNTAATASGYVTGIEPGTGFPFNRRIERHFGRVPKLKPGETRTFDLTFGLLEGDEVRLAVESVAGIGGGRPATIHSDPPEVPSFED